MTIISEHSDARRRLLDANLDRAREGLRVIEEWCRFGLNRTDLVGRYKDLRQRLGLLHQAGYKMARHCASDVGAGLCHPAQLDRHDPQQVIAANASRVQEALRVLEEFGRQEDGDLAGEAAAIRYLLYDLEVETLRSCTAEDQRRSRLAQCHLYLITSPESNIETATLAALQAGVRLVQYRAKNTSDCQQLDQAQRLRNLCQRYQALFVVNDRVDLALAVNADGVHLGQDDLPAAVARRLLGPNRLIGRSTHAIQQLRKAVSDGCDYVGIGPVYTTPTKPDRTPVGLSYVGQAVAESPIPCFAIGGVCASNLAQLRQVGADRVAVVRAITQAADPAAATSCLLECLGQAA